MTQKGASYTSDHLFSVARLLAVEAQQVEGKAIAAVPMAAAAVEARLNDFAGYAAIMAVPRDANWYFSELFRIAEDARRPVLERARLLFRVYEGKEPDMGAALWQDVTLLFQVRDGLMHRKPENYSASEEGDLQRDDNRLQRTVNRLIERVRLGDAGRQHEPLTWLVMRPGVARWGYDVAERFSAAMFAALPADGVWIAFRQLLQGRR